MKNKFSFSSLFLGACVFLGFTLLGYFIFKGLKTFSDKDRVVTVKGLAEMDMTAISSNIKLSFAFSGDDLQDVILQTENKKKAIISYLSKNGYDSKTIKINNADVVDRQKYFDYQWENGQKVQVKIDRYTISQGLSIQYKNLKETENKISKIKLDLVNKNLTCQISSKYTFPKLNKIKPQLIAESTKNARIAGDQFANDSQAKLGKIKTASQGQISLLNSSSYVEDESSAPQEPYIQKARVVSRIVFFLE